MLANIKAPIKKFPWLFFTLKWTYELLLKIVRLPAGIVGEISHFVEACKVLKGFDIFLVSGGGQIDDYWGGPWGHPYSLFKWALISRFVSARYAFCGVGTGSLKSKLSTLFIRFALNLANYRSFRDKKSKELLESIAFIQNDQVCPDLAYSFDRKRVETLKKTNQRSKKLVGVNVIAHMRQNMPKKDLSAYECYLNNLAVFLKELIRKEYSIVLFLTDSPDRHVIKELGDILTKENSPIISGKICEICTNTLDKLFDGFEGMDIRCRLDFMLLCLRT